MTQCECPGTPPDCATEINSQLKMQAYNMKSRIQYDVEIM